MDINQALFTYLSGYAGLSALVSNRIYPDILPQGMSDAAVAYQLIDEDEVDTFHQPASTMITGRYQFDSYAPTRAGANAISDQIRAAFKNYSGVTGGAGGVTVNAVEKINRTTTAETDREGHIIAYRTISEFEISYQE